jgi:hypothetical protein
MAEHWDPDKVIPRKPKAEAVDPEIDAERKKMGIEEDQATPLTDEQKRARAERFVWKPGDLRRVR